MRYVDLQTFFPWGMILQFVRATILFNFVHLFLKDKIHTAVTYCSILGATWLYAIVALPIASQAYEVFFGILYYIIIFCVVFFCTEGKVFVKIAAIIFSWMVNCISSISAPIVFSLIGVDPKIFTQYTMPVILFCAHLLFIFAFSILLLALTKILQNKFLKHSSQHVKYAVLLFFPFTHIFTAIMYVQSYQMLTGSTYEAYKNAHPHGELITFFFFVCCLLFDFLILLVVDCFDRIESRNIQMEKALLKNKLDYQQTAMLTEEKKEFRKLKHDFSNILTTVQGFIEIGKPEKALSVLQNTYTDLTGLAGFSVCANETINTILYMKIQQAKELGVTLESDIQEMCGVQIDDYDLCRLLSNILDNALNAAAQARYTKSVQIQIEITEASIHIHCENSFAPSQSERKRKKSDAHGHGVGIIKEITKNYQGSYQAHFEEDIYYTDTLLRNGSPKKK